MQVDTGKKDMASVEHVEDRHEDYPEKSLEAGEPELDRFGARVHMDPAEKALVRKLDIYMMVSLVPTACHRLLSVY